MEEVLVIENEGGACWAQCKSWKLDGVHFHRSGGLESIVSLPFEPALIIINLDCNNDELESTSHENDIKKLIKDVPTFFVCRQSSLADELLTWSEHNIELCTISNTSQHLRKRVTHTLKLARDAKLQVRRLANLQSKHQVLLDTASEGIIQYSNSGEIEYANPKALKLLHYSADEIEKFQIFDLVDAQAQDNSTEFGLVDLKNEMLSGHSFTCNRVFLKTSKKKQIVAEMNCSSVMDNHDEPYAHFMMFQDITARTLNEQRLIKLAKYDVLTGLSNRAKFHDFTEGKIAYCEHNNKKLAVLFIDLDHFKNINDSMGHDAGDDLLIAVSERLRNCIRETDLVARMGGDEFAITLLEMGNPNQVTRIVQNILEVLAKPLFIQTKEINISASVGISLYPENGVDIKTLAKTAGTAVHQAKADGRNTYRFFSQEIQNTVIEQHSLEIALKRAIANDEFSMHYQPLIDTVSGRIVGLEALIRWQHDDWPNIGPHRFIPVAEECGLLPALGKWVLNAACQQSVKWLNDASIQFNYPISVNLSPKQLIHNDFIDVLTSVIDSTDIPPENLILELTETAIMQNPDVAISILNKINSAGVKLAMDDFGTGYSSLSYLKKLPISKLKIDRSFVNDIGVNANGEAIVKAILALAHSLNLETVGEGVEEQSQADFLRGHNCEMLQGYLFGKPLPVDEISELLRQECLKWQPAPPELLTDAEAKIMKPQRPLH